MKQLTLSKAIAIAAEAHEYQEDKSGNPYILHPLFVMNKLREKLPARKDMQAIAVLHDVIEDTEWFLEKIPTVENENIFTYTIGHPSYGPIELTKLQYETLSLLTHEGDSRAESYGPYIQAIIDSGNTFAMFIKMFDLEHNTDIRRMIGTSKKDIDRLEKYFKTYEKIKEALIMKGYLF